tara:strand:+ start:138 stop:770 length:633 start_codon:yes stop_codon:yes gene_type:complete
MRYEHLTIDQALRKIAKEQGKLTKEKSELLFRIAKKVKTDLPLEFIHNLPEYEISFNPQNKSEIWKQMRRLIQRGKYDEAREIISTHWPEWIEKCDEEIQKHSGSFPQTSKTDIYYEICDILGIDDISLATGSTVRKGFYNRVIRDLDLEEEKLALRNRPKNKQQLAMFIIEQAGLGDEWDDTYSSTGSTVTADGLNLVLKAVRKLEFDE